MKYEHKNINFMQHDFSKFDFRKNNIKYELVLSDIAPNSTGHKSTDHLKISSIIYDLISILDTIAKKDSNLVFKIWKGIEEKNIINSLKKIYKIVSYFKPNSSRKESSEIYIVAQKFIV